MSLGVLDQHLPKEYTIGADSGRTGRSRLQKMTRYIYRYAI